MTGFILSAVLARTITSFSILLLLIVILCVASQIPLKFFLVRATFFIPIFTGLIALPLLFITPGTSVAEFLFGRVVVEITQEGIERAVQFTFRVWVCVAFMSLLVLTTKFSRLLRAMENLRFPKVFVAMTAMTYRFIFLFINEAYRMALAKESRTVRRQKWREYLGSLGSLIATLFLRAYERGERVYLAMLARGYDGTMKTLDGMKCKRRDWIFMGFSLLTCTIVLSVGYLGLGVW